MKRLSSSVAASLALLIVSVLFISSGCSNSKNEGFAIYLTRTDVPPDQMVNLSHFDLADKPVIATSDIVSYNSATHEIALTDAAFERIAGLQVPVRGKSFVVCVDKKPIYWGAFWTPISSISFDGVTIWKPLGTQESKIIKLELGYPSPSFYGGDDPRSNSEIIQALDKVGKLTTTANTLPHSMKGYELYSWQQDGQWHFTLITGTNRNKTLEEITAVSNTVTPDEWVQIYVVGVEAAKALLPRIPPDEWVMWLGSLRELLPSSSSLTIALPDAATVADIKAYAGQLGLIFSVD